MQDYPWPALDKLIDKAMALWGVPGLAVSVVRGDEVIYLKGYGRRDLGDRVMVLEGYGTSDLGAGAPVTSDTQFLICSLTRFSEIGKIQYGYGLRREHYRGNVTVGHTGSQPGWGMYMTMMPEHRIGVVVLTNREHRLSARCCRTAVIRKPAAKKATP